MDTLIDFLKRMTSRKLWVTVFVMIAGIAAVFWPAHEERWVALAQKIGGFLALVLPVLWYVPAQAELDKIKGPKKDISWGNQIRSYVLQPYRMVKDQRSGHEEGNADKVLDGDIDGFIEAFLHWDAQQQ